MTQTLSGDWRKAIGYTPRSRAHFWINGRSQAGWPIQSFARPVCGMVLKHRNTDPNPHGFAPEELCRKCLAWYDAYSNQV
jgi:hypothetical protein